MTESKLCRECERTLLEILETVHFDLESGCWKETARTPLFSICRIYLAYICGDPDIGPIDFSQIAVCPYASDTCNNPEHLRPGFFVEQQESNVCIR